MEDLWLFEFHPSKQGLSAKLETENKQRLYNRFRTLTGRSYGLPAAKAGLVILYEISSGGNTSVQINMKCSLVRPPPGTV